MIAITLAAALGMGLVAGCNGGGDDGGGGGTGSESGNGSGAGKAVPAFVSIGTAPVGGSFYNVGSALADALNQHAKEGGWRNVTAESTGGSLENLRRLDSNEIQLGLSNSSITYFAVRGEGGFDKKYNVRSVMTLHPLIAMFVTKQGSGIQKIADLKGKRVVVGPEGAGFEYFIRPILEAHGVTYKDFEPVYAGMQTSVGYLQDESVAATFLGGGLRAPAITSAASSMHIFLVPFDPNARTKLTETYPFYQPITVPAGTYRGQDADFAGLNVGSAHLICRADADDEFVYRVAKLIYESRESLAEKHAALQHVNAEDVVRQTGTEFHPGAIRYYREIGIWNAASGEPKAENGSQPSAPRSSQE